jgi:hypothetical protein
MDLNFDNFASELATGSAGTRSTTLGDVLAASTPLHWDEAVGLLQELVELTTAKGRDDIPSFADVVITAEGTLTIRGTRTGERGPVAAGRALHALLETADVPVALRLFVTQANVPETHASLDAFAKGLAYFGKSDRAELIRRVYARYKPAASTATPSSSATVAPPPPAAAPRRSPSLVTPRTLRYGLIAAVAVVAVASLVAIVWVSLAHGVQIITTSMGTVADSGASAQPTAAARETKKTATTASKPSAAVKTQGTRQADALTHAPFLPTHQFRVVPTSPSRADRPRPRGGLAADRTPTAPAQIASAADAFISLTTSVAPFVAPRESAPASAVYSYDDLDVQPPVMRYPQLPPPLLIGGPSEGLVNRMELLVASDGSVEHVRLLNAPRRMADMMLLSGAKLWKFTPASRDGVAVRYRTIVSWTVFP